MTDGTEQQSSGQPQGGQSIFNVAKPQGTAEAAQGTEPQKPPATPEPAEQEKENRAVKAGTVPPVAGTAEVSSVPTPEGHPDTLSDEQKTYIHNERKKAHDEAIKKIDVRIAEQRALGKINASFPRRWMNASGVQAALLNRGYKIDKGHDPLNYQVRFGDKG